MREDAANNFSLVVGIDKKNKGINRRVGQSSNIEFVPFIFLKFDVVIVTIYWRQVLQNFDQFFAKGVETTI